MNDFEFLKSLYLPYNDVNVGGNIPDFSSTIHEHAAMTFNNWQHGRDETLKFIGEFCRQMNSIHVELKEISCLNEATRCYVILSNWTLELIEMKGVKEVCLLMEIINLKDDQIIRAVSVMHMGGKLGRFLEASRSARR